MSNSKIVFTLMLLLGFSHCATRGQDFRSDFSWVDTDRTTEKDIRFKLGEPQAVGESSGVKTWTYGYYKFKLLGESFTKESKFYFNSDGTVKRYSFTSSFPEDRNSAGFGGQLGKKENESNIDD